MADEFVYTIHSDSANSLELIGLDTIKSEHSIGTDNKVDTNSVLELKPLEADLDLDAAYRYQIEPLKLELEAHPLKTDSSMTIDLKPAVIDLCLTTNIGKLPNVCIKQPYHHHVGFTLFGTEVWGYSFSGQQETVIEDVVPQPKVVWGGAESYERPPHHSHHERKPPTRDGGGLRIRLGS